MKPPVAATTDERRAPGNGMTVVMTSHQVRGQPLYRQWSDNKTRLYWFTREIEPAEMGWRLKRYVVLGTVKLDRRQQHKRIVARIREAEVAVLQLPGVLRVR